MVKNYEEAIKYIFDFKVINTYDLEKVRIWAQRLWNPQNNYKIIHVTGTNWKWSTCNMCFSVLKKWWKKVWIFTSPHLLDIRERFRTNDWLISESDFVEMINRILSLNLPLSYFEKCTLIAFEYFKKVWCEYAVIEVWVWWLLDSTNIVNPVITSIASIWYDHLELLWHTLEEISFQKAWIIKPGKPVVMNFHNEVIENIAREKWSPMIFTDKLISTNMIWDHQKRNAALAYEICTYIWVPKDVILQWLQEVVYRWRLEYLKDNLLIDWAHNEQWLEILQNYLLQIKDKYEKIIYCLSVKKGKEIRKLIVDKFWEDKEYIIVDQPHNQLIKLEDSIQQMSWIHYQIKTPKEIAALSEKNKNTLYVVFWSLYMIWWFYL